MPEGQSRLKGTQSDAERLRPISRYRIESLAATYMSQLGLPGKALRDAAHLAFACGYELDYLLTWNCAYIANAEIRRRLMAINAANERQTPIICTPEELMGMEDANNV